MRKHRWRDNVGFLVNRLSAAMQAEFESKLAALNIRRLQWIVLRDLYDGPQQPAGLAAKVGCDRAVMTRLLEALEQRGLLVRRISEGDRRQIDVQLTDSGRTFTERLIEISREVNEKFLRGVSRAQADEIIRTLQLMLANAPDSHRDSG